jgi:hypothetical protein
VLILIDQLINSTLQNNFSFKNDTTSTEKQFTFTKRSVCDKKNSKIQMGYKICTPRVQHFLGYEMAKWGIVPQNGVRLAALITA